MSEESLINIESSLNYIRWSLTAIVCVLCIIAFILTRKDYD